MRFSFRESSSSCTVGNFFPQESRGSGQEKCGDSVYQAISINSGTTNLRALEKVSRTIFPAATGVFFSGGKMLAAWVFRFHTLTFDNEFL